LTIFFLVAATFRAEQTFRVIDTTRPTEVEEGAWIIEVPLAVEVVYVKHASFAAGRAIGSPSAWFRAGSFFFIELISQKVCQRATFATQTFAGNRTRFLAHLAHKIEEGFHGRMLSGVIELRVSRK
jgi:hypothetical protein